MSVKFAIVTLICCTAIAPRLEAGPKEDAWRNLTHITRARNYTVALHGGACYLGEVVSLNHLSVALQTMNGKTVTILREDVLRFGEEIAIDETVYSGRSSWLDVEQLPLNSKEHTRVEMKDGKSHEGKLIKSTANGVTMIESGRRVELMKQDISTVYFVRLRPWSASEEFRMREDFIFFVFNPKFWSMELNAGPKIPVLLYDASVTEDDTPFKCNGLPN
jgi:hypothetical protein